MAKPLPATLKRVLLLDSAAPCDFVCKMVRKSCCGSRAVEVSLM